MSIPDYQSIMLPLLQFASDNKEHAYREAVISLADQFKLTDKERKELLPSGKQPTFDNRVGWAKTYMEKAGLFEKTRRAYFKITPRGQELLASKPKEINREVLMQFDEFIEFTQLRHNDNDEIRTSFPVASSGGQTPEEALEAAHQTLRQGLSNELLITIKQCSPEFFERLVVDLLITMGYGGSRREAGQAVGRSGDGGIDGIIKEDKLGLDTIYTSQALGRGSRSS